MIVWGCFVSLIGYFAFLAWCRWQWKHVSAASHQGNQVLPAVVTVVVPVRDEQEGVIQTLEALDSQICPGVRLEVLVVDDHSTDETVLRVQAFCRSHHRCRLLELTDEWGKKAAISRGVHEALGEWVFTVDGDAVMGQQWLSTMLKGRIGTGTGMLCGPVVSSMTSSSLLQRLARWESVGLTVIAAAGIGSRNPFFCNGANLGFKREEFLRLDGYSGNDRSLSGDDTTLLRKFKPEQVNYVAQKAAVVQVAGARQASRFMGQRQRWASKIPHSLSWFTLFIAFVAWCAHTSFLVLLAMALTDVLPWAIPAFSWLLMALMEMLVLKAGKRLVNERVNVLLLLVAQPVYALAIVIVGIAAVVLPFTWKGRKSR